MTWAIAGRGAAAVMGAALATLALAALPAAAQEAANYVGHALAMRGEPKYPADFAHFDYVNPDAPKGGSAAFGVAGSFDSLNPFIVQGRPAAGLALTLDTLMVDGDDEPFTQYGLIAETVEMPPDRGWIVFNLRPQARFHDGSPITPADVIFSFEQQVALSPRTGLYYADVVSATAVGEHAVRFDFKTNQNPELPLILGQLAILSQAYWTAPGRDLGSATLEPWLTSGPYRVAAVDPGRSISYERVPDYWAAQLPVKIGSENFDTISYDYYRDTDVLFEAFRAGEFDIRIENISRNWATGYDIPAVHAGVLVREELTDGMPQAFQGLFFNLRRPVFQDVRVRRALALAFDFAWTNANLFYGLYQRTGSFFAVSELAATGLPEGAELAVLEPFRAELPAELFTTAFAPAGEGGELRANLREASRLLEEAGWRVVDGVRTHAETGQRLEFEILLDDPTLERPILPYAEGLERIGIKAGVRTVDTSQYRERLDHFDYDMIMEVIAQSISPGNEQRYYWGSAAAGEPGSSNYSGLSDPVVDALIELVIAAPTREDLVARTRALDRVLLWRQFAIPLWNNPVNWIAYWGKFDHPRPDPVPVRGISLMSWWVDPARAATLDDRRRQAGN